MADDILFILSAFVFCIEASASVSLSYPTIKDVFHLITCLKMNSLQQDCPCMLV